VRRGLSQSRELSACRHRARPLVMVSKLWGCSSSRYTTPIPENLYAAHGGGAARNVAFRHLESTASSAALTNGSSCCRAMSPTASTIAPTWTMSYAKALMAYRSYRCERDSARRKILRDGVRAASRNPDGALIIPSFAIECGQELVVDLHFLIEQSEIPTCPIFIDSPLAMRASQTFQAHEREPENGDLLARAMRSKNVRFTESVVQSKRSTSRAASTSSSRQAACAKQDAFATG